MSRETLAILCDVISFFLVTTELYGEDRAKDLNSRVIGLVDWIQRTLRIPRAFFFIYAFFALSIFLSALLIRQPGNPDFDTYWKALKASLLFPLYVTRGAYQNRTPFASWSVILLSLQCIIIVVIPGLRLWLWLVAEALRRRPQGLFLGLGTIIFLYGKWLSYTEIP